MPRILIILLFIGCIACNSQNSQTVSNNEEVSFDTVNGPYMHFEKDSLDLGKIVQGDKVNCIFRFKNMGKSDLLIYGVQAGCGCTITEWDPKPIAPGSESEIKVVFNSTGKKGKQVKSIDVKSNAVISEKHLRFTCEVVSSN